MLDADTPYVISEFLPGEEYTVDCVSNGDGALLHAAPRRRMRVKGGISVRTEPACADPGLREMAAAIAGELRLRGAWFFQARRDREGVPKLLEVAPRIAGSMALSRVRGNVLQLRAREALAADFLHSSRLDVPLLYLQSARDLLVGSSGKRNVQAIASNMRTHRLDAPHFLLQVCPREAAEAIASSPRISRKRPSCARIEACPDSKAARSSPRGCIASPTTRTSTIAIACRVTRACPTGSRTWPRRSSAR